MKNFEVRPQPPKSGISSIEQAYYYYQKLSPFLGIKTEADFTYCPQREGDLKRYKALVKVGGETKDYFNYSRELYNPETGGHHPVRWMPVLKSKWRRLKFDEFLLWYGLKNLDKTLSKR